MHITLLGPVRVDPPIKLSRKALGLLAYLALQPSRSATRAAIADLLWPEVDNPRHSLRNCLYELPPRTFAGRGQTTIGLADDVTTNLAGIETLDALLDLAWQPPLDSLDDIRSERFEEWLARAREDIAKRIASRARSFLPFVSNGQRLALTRLLTQIDPWDEEACRLHLSALAENGKRAQAVREYQRFTSRLARELQLRPAAETQRLVDAIRRAA